MTTVSEICDRLVERHRQRQDLHRAEISLTHQIKATCRRLVGGDVRTAKQLYEALTGKGEHEDALMAMSLTDAFRDARFLIQERRLAIEEAMKRDAMALPIWPRVAATSGFGALSLASLVGETGDLSRYSTHSKLWKRLGLAVIDGERQQRKAGAAAFQHGYSPSRRAVMWKIGNCMLRSQSGRGGRAPWPAGPYRIQYDARKELETTRVATKAHAHNRAARYMEKRLVRKLWEAWTTITT